ncbi:MAG: hypothetical protein AB3N16_04730, partial [Flavobacteriaceae bacterium]
LNMPKKDMLLLEKLNLKPQEMFNKISEIRVKSDSYLFYYGFENVSVPSNKLKKDVSKEMKFYMIPFSGITYGCRGGYGNGILKNRCAFKNLLYSQNLEAEDLVYIMKSVNLASRLTAIEYYTKNIDQFDSKEKGIIDALIYEIFKEYGNKKIKILLGDIGYHLTIEDAVNRNLEENCW